MWHESIDECGIAMSAEKKLDFISLLMGECKQQWKKARCTREQNFRFTAVYEE